MDFLELCEESNSTCSFIGDWKLDNTEHDNDNEEGRPDGESLISYVGPPDIIDHVDITVDHQQPPCSFSQFGAKCSGCEKGVAPTEVIRRANDHVYHFDCFKCLICSKLLETGEEFFLMENQQLVCKNDYEMAKSKG